MNFPTWHDPIDALIFPLTTERLVDVMCSLDRLAVADQQEYARTHALAWHRLTRLLLEHYSEWDVERVTWLGVLVLYLTTRRAKLPELAVLVVTLELARAGVEDGVIYAPSLLGVLDASD